MPDEFYRVALRKKIYATIEDLQTGLDLWMREFNEVRPDRRKWRFGKTPLQTFLDAIPLAKEKSLPFPDGDQTRPRMTETRPALPPPSDQVETSTIQEVYIQGVSTRLVDDLVKVMGGTGVSKSQVSRLCEEIDGKVKAFLDRPLEGDWPYVCWHLPQRRRHRSPGRRHPARIERRIGRPAAHYIIPETMAALSDDTKFA